MSGPACASAGCDNALERHPGRVGRPPIYCSPACRPSRASSGSRNPISVDIEQDDHDGGRLGRCWIVTLRRGTNTVVVGRDLGRFSATVLSAELRALMNPRTRQEGDAIK